MLTRLQKTIIGVGTAGVLILAGYVPWVFTLNANGISREKSAGYHSIFDPPRPEKEHAAHGVKIDAMRVAIPMAAVVLATIAAVLLTGARREEHGNRERLTGGSTNEAPRLAEVIKRSPQTQPDEPTPPVGIPPGATGPAEAPAATPDHDQQERDSTALFSSTIAVVVIWGTCRAVFGSEFGGFCEAFVVILIGGIVGPRVARRLASASPSATAEADAVHNLSQGEIPSDPAGPSAPQRPDTEHDEARRAKSPQPTPEDTPRQRSAASSAGRADAPATEFLLNGPLLSLVLIALFGSAIGVAVVVLARNTDPPPGNVQPHTPPAQDPGRSR